MRSLRGPPPQENADPKQNQTTERPTNKKGHPWHQGWPFHSKAWARSTHPRRDWACCYAILIRQLPPVSSLPRLIPRRTRDRPLDPSTSSALARRRNRLGALRKVSMPLSSLPATTEDAEGQRERTVGSGMGETSYAPTTRRANRTARPLGSQC
jgi:hypothetical protein